MITANEIQEDINNYFRGWPNTVVTRQDIERRVNFRGGPNWLVLRITPQVDGTFNLELRYVEPPKEEVKEVIDPPAMMYKPQISFYFTKRGALEFAAELIQQAMATKRPEQQHIKVWFNGSTLNSWETEIGESSGM